MAIFITGGARSGKSDFAERYAMRLAASGVYIATSQIWDEEMRQRIGLHQASRADSGYSWRTIEEPYGLAETLRALEAQFAASAAQRPAVVVDCLTLWLSNQLLRLEPVEEADESEGASGSMAVSDRMAPVEAQAGADREPRGEESAAADLPIRAEGFASESDHFAARQTYVENLDALVDQLAEAVAAYRGPLLLVTNEVGSGIVPAYALGRRFRDAAGRMNRKLASVCEEAYMVVAGFPLDLKKLAFRLEDA
ncbi:bifunctional adenosylcobinamide kinase/adenosylcobinamide-phosphate guanylyltransferase [Paenibacillus aurantiacus]|uniref:Adenosylcobinamide kinase n=1 Tax=Paenibacillus aurantiacus TaxID=1936118 RepID=A0ABV5KX63_9BACL